MITIPHGDTFWTLTDTITIDGVPFLFAAGDAVVLEITHTSTGTVVERAASFTVGTNAVSYLPILDDVAAVEILQLRWKITRAGLVGHIPTTGKIALNLI